MSYEPVIGDGQFVELASPHRCGYLHVAHASQAPNEDSIAKARPTIAPQSEAACDTSSNGTLETSSGTTSATRISDATPRLINSRLSGRWLRGRRSTSASAVNTAETARRADQDTSRYPQLCVPGTRPAGEPGGMSSPETALYSGTVGSPETDPNQGRCEAATMAPEAAAHMQSETT